MKKLITASVLLAAFATAGAQGVQQMRVAFPGYAGPRAALHDFPALVVFTNNVGGSGFDFANPEHQFGDDLRFFDASGAPLDYEFDTFDPPNQVLAWVKLPELRPDGETFIHARWGDPGWGRLPCVDNGAVWSAGYTLVQHYSTGGPSIADASPANRTGTIRVRGGYEQFQDGPDVPGRIGGSVNLSGGGSYKGIMLDPGKKVPVDNSVSGAWTVSTWYRNLLPSSASWRTLIRSAHLDHYVLVSDPSEGVNRIGAYSSGFHPINTGATMVTGSGEWRHLAVVVTGGHTLDFYDNGVYAGTSTIEVPSESRNQFEDHDILSVGCCIHDPAGTWTSTPEQKFADYLDEFRTSNRARTPDWIWAEHGSQGGNPGFAAYDPPAVYTEPVIIPSAFSPLGATNATFNADMAFDGPAVALTFFWREANSVVTNRLELPAQSGGPVAATMSPLSPATEYLCWLRATNLTDAAWSEVFSPAVPFTTWPLAPVLDQREPETGYGVDAATLRCGVAWAGIDGVVDVVLYYGVAPGGQDPSAWDSAWTNLGAVAGATVVRELAGLAPGTPHYFVWSAGGVWTEGGTFTPHITSAGLRETHYLETAIITADLRAEPSSFRQVRAPYAVNEWTDDIDRPIRCDLAYGPDDDWPPPPGYYIPIFEVQGWNGNSFRYSGYMYVAGDGPVSFRGYYRNGLRFCLDDAELLFQVYPKNAPPTPPGYPPVTCVVRPGEGWHKFDLWFETLSWVAFGPYDMPASPRVGFAMDALGGTDYVFPKDPGDGSLFRTTFPKNAVMLLERAPVDIGDTSVLLPVRVEADPAAFPGGTLRVYHTPDAPALDVEDFLGWPFVEHGAPVTASGDFALAVSNLVVDTLYHFRHVLQVGGAEHRGLRDGVFTTRPLDTPARFAVAAPNYIANWDAPGVWKNLDNRARKTPGVAGDSIQPCDELVMPRTRPSLDVRHTVGRDLSIGSIYAGGNFQNDRSESPYLEIARAPNVAAVTLSLDAGGTADHALVCPMLVPSVFLGNWIDRQTTNVTLRLNQPLLIDKNGANREKHGAPVELNGWPATDVFAHGALTGGTGQDPRPITLRSTHQNNSRYTHLRFLPTNPNNTFRGDFLLHALDNWLLDNGVLRRLNIASLHIGGFGRVGGPNTWGTWNPDNALLGDPANRVIMTRPSCSLFIQNGDAFTLGREVVGNGRIIATQLYWNSASEEETVDIGGGVMRPSRRPLQFGPGCVLKPGFDGDEGVAALLQGVGFAPAPFGSMTLAGSEIRFDSAARVVIKVAPGGGDCDTLVLDLTSAGAGHVALGGVVEVVPAGGAHIRPGTSWTFLENTTPCAFSGAFIRPAGYALDYATDPSGNLLSATLTKRNPGSLLLLR